MLSSSGAFVPLLCFFEKVKVPLLAMELCLLGALRGELHVPRDGTMVSQVDVKGCGMPFILSFLQGHLRRQ